MNDSVELTGADLDLIWHLSGTKPCSLETKPGNNDNWIERTGSGGNLPNYICVVAKGVMRSGKSRSSAIAIAISRIKAWASGRGDVNADTRAKAAKALAQWEALKAKSKAKQLIKATSPAGDEFIILSSVDSYSLDQVRDAWDRKMVEARKAIRAIEETTGAQEVSDGPYGYVREVYVDFVIVSFEDTKEAFYRVPYEVNESEVTFGAPSPVQLTWTDDNSDWRISARR